MEFNTPTECQAKMNEYETLFLANVKEDAKFGYTLRCEERDE